MFNYLRRHSADVSALATVIAIPIFFTAKESVFPIALIAVVVLAAIYTLASLFRFRRKLRPYRKTVILTAIALILAILSCYHIYQKNALPQSLADSRRVCRITGYATEEGTQGLFGKTNVTVTKLDGQKCNFDISLYRTNLASPEPYRYFTAEIFFDLPTDRAYTDTSENIIASASVTEMTLTDKQVKSFAALSHRFASRIEDRLFDNLDEDSAALAGALLIGRREALSDTLQRDFQTLGITHLLAVSGMHLSVLTAGLSYLFGKLHIQKGVRLIIISLFIFLYAGICGFSPSILRAGVMSVCLLIAHTAGERAGGLRALLFSTALILLISPYLITSVSLQLSVFATLGILVFYPLFIEKKYTPKRTSFPARIIQFVFAELALTLSSTVFTLPVVYYRFGSFSLVSALANILFVPIVTLLMYVLPVYLLLTFIPFLSALIQPAVQLICHSIEMLAGYAVYCKDLYCTIPLAVLIAILLLIPILLVLRRFRIKHFPVIAVLALYLPLTLAYPLSLTGDAELAYRFDQERETLLLQEGNTVLLVETGNASTENAYVALTQTKYTLKQTGIDILLLTHYHNASTGFVQYLCENTYPDRIYLPNPANDTDRAIANIIAEISKEHGIETIFYTDKERIAAAGFDLRIRTERLSRSDHPAQAIEIVKGSSRVLAADPAIFELDGIGAVNLSGVDHLLFLSSPPMDKYPLPPFKDAPNVHAIYGSKEQYTTIGCRFGSHTVLSPDSPYVYICF